MKKILSIIACVFLVFSFISILNPIFAKADAYKIGDTITFGTYPKTDVTKELGEILNQLPGEWQSYDYIVKDASTGELKPSDYMRYKDVTYLGTKYRAVTFDNWRTNDVGNDPIKDNSSQDSMGYLTNHIYWFKFEALKWIVLNPSKGLVICDSVIDNQPFNNYRISNGTDRHNNYAYAGDSTLSYPANDYSKSSIRIWLNDTFYNTAFSKEQQQNISETFLNNDNYYTLKGGVKYHDYDTPSCTDNVFLLSCDEVSNEEYHLNLENNKFFVSDYSKCQGFSNYVFDAWILRTSGFSTGCICGVWNNKNQIVGGINVDILDGIRPALCMRVIKSESNDSLPVKSTNKSEINDTNKKSIPFKVENRIINIDTDWNWDYFNKNASEYDHHLTMAGLLLSQAAEVSANFVEHVLSDKDNNNKNDFGFEHPKSVYYGDKNYKIHPAATFASKQVTINGSKKILIAVVTRGTSSWNDFITDLGSVFDGFFNASENVFYELENYIKTIKTDAYYDIEPTKDNTIFFITGHSLGGAVSQLLAKKCESYYASRNNIFAYTFAAPNVETGSYNVDAYTNIHNIINSSDAVPIVPVGYKKFGHCWYYVESFHETDEAERTVFGGAWNAMNAEMKILYNHLLNRYLTFVLSGLPKNMGAGASNPYNLSSVHCPVDITVYNKEGKLLGYTKGDYSTFTEDSTVLVYTDGESKYVVAPDGVEYTIKFTATGDGTMTYIQQKRENIGDEVLSEKKFENVEIKKGDIFKADVTNDNPIENIVFEKADEDAFAGYDKPDDSDLMNSGGKIVENKKLITIIIIVSAVVVALLIAAIVFIILRNKKKQAQPNEVEEANVIPQETTQAQVTAPLPIEEKPAPTPAAPQIEYSCKEMEFGGRCGLCKNETETLYLVTAKKEGKEQKATVCRSCAERVIAKFKKQNSTNSK